MNINNLNISTIFWSSLQQKVATMLAAGNIDINTIRIQKFFVRQVAALTSTTKGYQLRLDAGGPLTNDVTNLLPANDAFVMGAHRMSVVKKKGIAGGAVTWTVADGQCYTWPNKAVFDYAPAGSVPEADSIASLFNGNFGLNVDNDLVISKMSTQEFLCYQQGDSSGNQGDYPDVNANTFKRLNNAVVLLGNQQILANFDFYGTFTNVAGDSTATGEANYLDYTAVGYRLVNQATSVKQNLVLNF